MLGGERLRGLLVAPHDRHASQDDEAREWLHSGRSPAGEEVWERFFETDGASFQVAVHVDPHRGKIRTLYTTSSESEKFPEIPSSVRRQVEAFKEHLRAG